ncbi:MAG: lipase [Pseudonocardia sp.]|nr:lipase [Pseudonocardia sp.]
MRSLSGPRRALLAAAACVAVVAGAAIGLPRLVAVNRALPAEPVPFALPAPTGPGRIGSLDLHLVDHDRPDPWAPDGGPREVVATLWYPALPDDDAPPVPYLAPRVASFLDQSWSEIGVEPGAVAFAEAVTHAHNRAPVADAAPRAVLLYSPGGGNPRAFGTTLVEDLVSHGYVVLAVDSTYQAPVELPDGLTFPARGVDMKQALAERVHDLRFALDQLGVIRDGGNPDAARRALPAGIGALLDLDRVGLFGHSMGGFAAAETMLADRRVDVGANLDGSMTPEYSADPAARLDRPFLLLSAGTDGDRAAPHTHLGAPDLARYWDRMTGWKREVHLPDGEHMSLSDLQSVLPAIAAGLPLDTDAVRTAIGTVDPAASLQVQRRYLRALFDQHLRGTPQPVLDAVPADLSVAELVR